MWDCLLIVILFLISINNRIELLGPWFFCLYYHLTHGLELIFFIKWWIGTVKCIFSAAWYVALVVLSALNISWVLVPARWSSKAFFLLSLLIPDASTKYQGFLSHFSHLWASDFGSPLALNGAIDGIPKFAAAIWYKYCETTVVFLVIMSFLTCSSLVITLDKHYNDLEPATDYCQLLLFFLNYQSILFFLTAPNIKSFRKK